MDREEDTQFLLPVVVAYKRRRRTRFRRLRRMFDKYFPGDLFAILLFIPT